MPMGGKRGGRIGGEWGRNGMIENVDASWP